MAELNYQEAIDNIRFLQQREQANLIAKRILDDLTNRKGFDGAWDDCSEDIQKEIEESFASIALRILQNV